METRPLTLEERKALAASAKRMGGWRDRLFAASFAAIAVLGIGLLAAERVFAGSPASQAVPTALAVIVGMYVYRRVNREEWRAKQTNHLSEELAAGVAEITRFSARNAIRVEEFEDEGLSFFVELTDGRILFLSGQYLYESDETDRFPNTSFTIVRTPRTRTVLEFDCRGDYFPPVETRSPFTDAEYRQGSVPSDGDILDFDFSILRRSSAL